MGLSAISLPDTRVNLYELVKKDGYVMSTSWEITYPKPDGSSGEMAAIPLSRCTSKKDKKGDFTELPLIMSVKKRSTTKRRTKGPKKRTTKRSTVRRGGDNIRNDCPGQILLLTIKWVKELQA